MTRNEKKLKQFYKEINNWIGEGCPDHPIFAVHRALCSNLNRWLTAKPWYTLMFCDKGRIRHIQDTKFMKEYGTCSFPFGYEDYAKQTNSNLPGNHYKNQQRIDFIRNEAMK